MGQAAIDILEEAEETKEILKEFTLV